MKKTKLKTQQSAKRKSAPIVKAAPIRKDKFPYWKSLVPAEIVVVIGAFLAALTLVGSLQTLFFFADWIRVATMHWS